MIKMSITEMLSDFYHHNKWTIQTGSNAELYTKIFKECVYIDDEQHMINVLVGNNYIESTTSYHLTRIATEYLKEYHGILFTYNDLTLGDSSPNITEGESHISVCIGNSINLNKVFFKRISHDQ